MRMWAGVRPAEGGRGCQRLLPKVFVVSKGGDLLAANSDTMTALASYL